MLEYLKNEANKTFTENGAVTYATTGSKCLDLFAAIGAIRNASDKDILVRFVRAYIEDKDIAMKLLFYARDIRGGLGERIVFRVIMNYLADNESESVKKNIKYIAEFGRYDDLLCLLGTACEKTMLTYLKEQFEADCAAMDKGEDISLLAKWLPSVNASNENTIKNAKKIARAFGISDAVYRKTLSSLRAYLKIIENNLREGDYTFDYEKQTSRALYKYRKAFYRNDRIRYEEFIERVEAGEAKLHADNIAPYELVESYLKKSCYDDEYSISDEEKRILNATWESFADYAGEENAITVIDTSGSMYWSASPSPASVALSLGLYFAERNKGAFKNHFITFSERPQLIEIKGETFADRLRYVTSFSEVANTNLEAVFELILNAAVKNHVSQEELPAKLIIISDMEFDACATNASVSNFENAKAMYAAYGYKLPEVVFWNAESRNHHQPVKKNEQGVCLVSGVTPRLFSMVARDNLSPYTVMMDVLSKERYAKIVA
ncbi:MAG: DUF2828 family protein [Lachnospiraceae bacterium]|nr:DUF2828 family protein [Lachnospiraceae bacterium]